MTTAILALIVVLGVLIFVHELGHFVAAKWAGIYVHRFSLGMGAPIKALSFRRGETEYAISWLPLGGYVKMASAEEEAMAAALEGGAPRAEVPPDRMFEAQPLWKRMIVILAGVTMNMLFAVLVYVGLAYHAGTVTDLETRVGQVDTTGLPASAAGLAAIQPGDSVTAVNRAAVASWNDILRNIQDAGGDSLTFTLGSGRAVALPIPASAVGDRLAVAAALSPWSEPVVDSVPPEHAAGRAGIQAGDSITAIDGEPVAQWSDIPRLVASKANAPITVAVVRDGEPRVFHFVADSQVVPDTGDATRVVGLLGVVNRRRLRHDDLSLPGAVAAGVDQTWSVLLQTGRSVQGLVTGNVPGRELGGPILIGQLAGRSARLGLAAFLAFMALISVNLAVLNLMPIPLLDGGQFVFLLAEGIIRRPLPLRVREALAMTGFALLMLLMVFVFYNDIRRVLGGFLGG